MDPQTRRRGTLDAIKRILLRESSINRMLIFEDLHWIDEHPGILNLSPPIGTAKILLLVNYRPEYSHQWNSKTYYTQLRLDPLGRRRRRDAERSARRRCGSASAEAADHRETEGNPSSWKRRCRSS